MQARVRGHLFLNSDLDSLPTVSNTLLSTLDLDLDSDSDSALFARSKLEWRTENVMMNRANFKWNTISSDLFSLGKRARAK